ncbi:MAG: PD40 domain-containing protein [Bacteroidia bacterium]|nr:PD40 domain-containing protein [Bacteroidia bacterium]
MFTKKISIYLVLPLCFLVVLFFTLPADTYCQNKKTKKKENDANGNFGDGNFDVALSQFLKLYQRDKLNIDYNYKIGICYLYTNIDKTLAVPYLEFAVKQSTVTNDAFFYLGKGYFHALQFDKAIDMFNKYKDLDRTLLARDKDTKDRVERAIEMCNNAKVLIKKPLNITFTNLGKNVNSNKADVFPFISEDEKTIFYSSNRKYVSDFQEFTFDIYYSTVSFWGRWGTGKSISSKINTSDETEVMIGMSKDAELVFVEPDNVVGFQDIFVSHGVKGKYGELESPGEMINTKGRESGAAVTYSKDTLYFASDRPGGFGELDMWMSIRLPDGTWGPAQNIGDNVNTPYNENMPCLSKDGNTLYFSSEGHNSMGGYDIFVSQRNNNTEKWPRPRNIGYPINDTYDNFSFCMSDKGRYGYTAAIRKEGLGDYDIYKVVFNSEEPKPIVFRGKIAVGDSLHNKSPKEYDPDIIIIVKEKLATDIYGKYSYNKKNDSFVISLPPGVYDVEIESKSYQPYIRTIEVVDEMTNESVLNYNIYLKSVNTEDGGKNKKK